MRIQLLKNVHNLGHAGEIHECSAGYVRNFLFPAKAARLVTDQILTQVAARAKREATGATQEKKQHEHVRQLLQSIVVSIPMRANAQGTLYASPRPEQIIEAFAAQTNERIDGATFRALHTIETVGEHRITVTLQDKSSYPLRIRIEPSH